MREAPWGMHGPYVLLGFPLAAVVLLAASYALAGSLLDLNPCASAADLPTHVPLILVVVIGMVATVGVASVAGVRQTTDRRAALIVALVSVVVLPAAWLLQGGPFGWHCTEF